MRPDEVDRGAHDHSPGLDPMNAATSMMLELEWSFGLGGLAPATSRASAATGPRPPFVGAWDPLALLLTGSRTHGGLPWRWEELG